MLFMLFRIIYFLHRFSLFCDRDICTLLVTRLHFYVKGGNTEQIRPGTLPSIIFFRYDDSTFTARLTYTDTKYKSMNYSIKNLTVLQQHTEKFVS